MSTLPLPWDLYDGVMVVASTWGNDTQDDGPVWGVLLGLLPDTGSHYRVIEIEANADQTWHTIVRTAFENIGPAVEGYRESGGHLA